MKNQDKLDAVICLLVAIRWLLRPRTDNVMLDDLETGYMAIPASADVRASDEGGAAKVLTDGWVGAGVRVNRRFGWPSVESTRAALADQAKASAKLGVDGRFSEGV